MKCSSCGEQARWAVTLPYNPDDRAGRLLAYCQVCRERATSGLAIPLEFMTDDLFVALYEKGFTASLPDVTTETIFGQVREDLVQRVGPYLDPT